jgi:hypothetical protein
MTSYGVAMEDTTAPTTPSELAAINIGERQVELSWKNSTDEQSAIAYYRIFRDGIEVGKSVLPRYIDTGLVDNHPYQYQVSAVNQYNLESSHSSAINIATLIDSTPTGILSIDILSIEQIRITFDEPVERTSAEDISNYDIAQLDISQAMLSDDNRQVTLTTSHHQTGNYDITISGVADLAQQPNPLPSLSTSYTSTGIGPGFPVSLPGTIFMENYRLGGEGEAYHDTTEGNDGGAYRQDDVDISSTDENIPGLYHISHIIGGEWLSYDINLTQTGNYNFEVFTATKQAVVMRYYIEVDGVKVTETIDVPGTYGWTNFRPVLIEGIPLTAGSHRLRFVVSAGLFNVDRIEISLPPTGGSAAPGFYSAIQDGPWSDVNTWEGDRIPNTIDKVMIDGVKVTFDLKAEIHPGQNVISDAEAKTITVQNGGELFFSRTQSTRLDLDGSLMVSNGGTLDVGNSKEPIPAEHSAYIGFNVINDRFFTGNAAPGPMPNMPDFHPNDTGIWVMGVTSQAHYYGTPKNFIWQSIDGIEQDMELHLGTAPTGWRVGDQVLITPTGNNPEHNEIRTVTAINNNIVSLDRALEYDHQPQHVGYNEQTGKHFVIDDLIAPPPDTLIFSEKAEVALLTQNVTIASNWVSEQSPNHRAHTLYMMGAGGEIGYSEFRDLGPRAMLGRYPVHFHRLNDSQTFHVTGASIWSSVSDPTNKWITVHDSQTVSIDGCVGFNAQGRGFYLEDGMEVGNQLTNNLGVRVHAPEELPKFKLNNLAIEPLTGSAIFWLREGNQVTGNVAVGGGSGVAGFVHTASRLEGGTSLFQDNQVRASDIGLFFAEYPETAQGGDSFVSQALSPWQDTTFIHNQRAILEAAEGIATLNQPVLWNNHQQGTALDINDPIYINNLIDSHYDANADGTDDVLWRNETSGHNHLYFINQHKIAATASLPIVSADWQSKRGDFNGDGYSDILWRHQSTGQNWLYLLKGQQLLQSKAINTVDLSWHIAAINDFNGDNRDDIVWRHTSGTVWLYQMNGHVIQQSHKIATVASDWYISDSGDFNGDGTDDLIWRHQFRHETYIYQMLNGHKVAGYPLGSTSENWNIAGVGDLNGDGSVDILWRNSSTGQNWIYGMQNFQATTSKALNTVTDQNWQIEMFGDFDDNHIDDILWRHQQSGSNVIYEMGNFAIQRVKPLNSVNDLNWKVVK